MKGHGTRGSSPMQAIGGRITDPQVPAQIGRGMDAAPQQPSAQKEHKGSWGKKFGLTMLAGVLALAAIEHDAVVHAVKSLSGDSTTASSPTDNLKADLGGAPLDKEPAAKPQKNTFVSPGGKVACTGAAVRVVIQKKSIDGNSPLKAFQRTVRDESGEQWRLMQSDYVAPFLEDLSNWKGHHNPQIADKMPKGTVIDLPTHCTFPQIQLDSEP